MQANLYIETFGCQMNEADSRFIADRATAAGYTIVSDPTQAGVVVLNTCTVRDNAETRAYGRMKHLGKLKEADPTIQLVVCGCLAEQDRDRMQKISPSVDAVFGTAMEELERLADWLTSRRSSFSDNDESYADERALLTHMGGTGADCVADAFTPLRAFVTVQRGCSYYCTFCIVPYVRGRFDHRPMDAILSEARARIAQGAREIMLLGQTVNAWRDPHNGADFGDLCRAVAALEGLERLTFISPHPKDFTEKIVRDLAEIPQLNPRAHLPLQSGSDAMLKRMNRKYTSAQFQEKLDLFARYLPQWAITTDIIVGFPGETEEDFLATLEYCARGSFSQAFMFVYSPRRGTPAAQWEQVDPAVASERFKRLAAAQDAACRAYHDRKIGTVVRCLAQGVSRKDRTKLASKSLDNVTIIAPMSPGADVPLYAQEPWLDVRIESAFVWGCTGTIVRRARRFADEGFTVEQPTIDLTALV